MAVLAGGPRSAVPVFIKTNMPPLRGWGPKGKRLRGLMSRGQPVSTNRSHAAARRMMSPGIKASAETQAFILQ